MTLNDPDKRNTVSEDMTTQWLTVMQDLRTDLDIRAVVVTGAGLAFCAGADLAELHDLHQADLWESQRRLTQLYRD